MPPCAGLYRTGRCGRTAVEFLSQNPDVRASVPVAARAARDARNHRHPRRWERLIMRSKNAIRAYKRRAIIKAGWFYDEGGPHWFRPSDHPFSFPGSYARTVDEAFAEAGLEMPA